MYVTYSMTLRTTTRHCHCIEYHIVHNRTLKHTLVQWNITICHCNEAARWARCLSAVVTTMTMARGTRHFSLLLCVQEVVHVLGQAYHRVVEQGIENG